MRLEWVRALLVAELLVALAGAAALWTLRTQTLEAELRTLVSLSRAMALQADRTLGVADAVLRSTREELAHGLITPGLPAVDELLSARILPLDDFRALTVFGAQGQRLASSRRWRPAEPVLVTEQDVFQAAREARSPRLYISAPYATQVDPRPAISVTMNWNDDDGTFRGVLALVAEPDFLEGDFSRLAPAPDAQLVIHREDGAVLRPPAVPDEMLAQASAAWLRLRTPDEPAAVLVLPDGRVRLVAGARLAHQPLVVRVSRDAEVVLRAWRDLAWLSAAFMASAMAITLVLVRRIGRDRVRRQVLEARLQRARQLESLGQLAGGVAHDFNNVLASVIGYGEMAREALAEGTAPARHLDQVLQAGRRGRALVARILAFSRGQPRQRVVFALEPVVAEVLDHLEGTLAEGLRIERDLQGAGLALEGDPTALYEAIMNLARNAVQAMPEGGALRVSLQARAPDAARVPLAGTLPSGRAACLSLSDHGQGIAPETMARLFEPFFTTKGPREGTGLGLAIVHGVVTDLGGAIEVHSTPGQGSRFTLWLPLSSAPVPPPSASPAGEDEALPEGRGETVLVVDDEPALVELAEELLAGLGYEPLGLTSSARALEEFARDPARFDLVLCDEVMPGLTGTALAAELRRQRPDLPIVLATGYGGEQLEERARAAGIAVVVAKPLTRAELARALARALGRS
ncbi:MAG: hypothetical protein QG612_2827 [Pseudomonadota bacterium]|nr:hypothetical protein [Pseudomonadota bacterium]